MKILEASCAAHVVTADGLPVTTADVLSQGTKSSSGILLMDQDKAKYLTSNATDIADVITQLGSILNQIVTILTSLDAVTVAPGTSAPQIAMLVTLNTQLATIKELLK